MLNKCCTKGTRLSYKGKILTVISDNPFEKIVTLKNSKGKITMATYGVVNHFMLSTFKHGDKVLYIRQPGLIFTVDTLLNGARIKLLDPCGRTLIVDEVYVDPFKATTTTHTTATQTSDFDWDFELEEAPDLSALEKTLSKTKTDDKEKTTKIDLCNAGIHTEAATPLQNTDDDSKWWTYCKRCGTFMKEFKTGF